MTDFNSSSNTMANAGIYTDFNGLASLKKEAAEGSEKADREVAQQFESVFVQMMLKTMRDASDIGESSESDETRFYQDMFDKQIALDLARGDGIGLAAVIQRELGGVDQPVPASPRSFANETERQWNPASTQDFIEDIWPHASRIAEELNISPEVIVAQSALESQWGQRVSRNSNGESSLNLFGIKADERWQGETVRVSTLEYRDGVASQEQASFRAYESRQQSIEDYARFLQDNPRYQNALASGQQPEQFAQELQTAGYATDPAYAKKISSIMQREEFVNTVAELKMADSLVD